MRSSLFTILVFTFFSVLLTSCASSTIIQTDPPGAQVFIDGVLAGTSPVHMTNKKVVTSCTDIRIEKEGYERLLTDICRDEEPAIGPIIGGFFFGIPWLWAFEYQASHFYTLEPVEGTKEVLKKPNDTLKTKQQQLMELKELYEKNLITEEEYTKAKEAILKKYF